MSLCGRVAAAAGRAMAAILTRPMLTEWGGTPCDCYPCRKPDSEVPS